MLSYDNFTEIAKYAHRKDLLNILSTCYDYRRYIGIYYDKYIVTIKDNSKKSIVNNFTKVHYDYKKNIYAKNLLFGDKIEWLYFSDKYNDDIINLPRNIKFLRFGNKFNKPIINTDKYTYTVEFYRRTPIGLHIQVPTWQNPLFFFNLISIEFGKEFNQPIDNLLPQTLKKLILGNDFNQPINNLPKNLETLILGKKFNQNIDNLPKNLKKLILGRNFRYPINNIPNSIEYLEYNSKKNIYSPDIFGFNIPINKLPNLLTTFKWVFSHLCVVPNFEKLKYLKHIDIMAYDLNYEYYLSILSKFETIKILRRPFLHGLGYKFEIFEYNAQISSLKIINNMYVNNIPNGIKILDIYRLENIDDLPTSIETLNIHIVDTPINYLPINIKNIIVGNEYEKELPYLENVKVYASIYYKYLDKISNIYKSNLIII